ncbi:putative oxidoreductase C-terminal domain-containing protein [Algoriphagus pacificus]|uniref:Gfo/Idh/MocA family oxidoreductase n=1 Tax=Algoriphagus pacificus TaxID=2811234 RepID=A0ABS3CGE9_9BACT|nr:putative oxidoreductase C-terminal domain-containing protein [Algoriphagus pacificus]MBN7816162.1 Gfo/Idh/MocA family oxidoreductase [Algoriphagus pacificus]
MSKFKSVNRPLQKAVLIASAILFQFCDAPKEEMNTEKSSAAIQIVSLDPGHFHAGLIHKSMYPEVDSTIHVYAPEGEELGDYLKRIAGYNERPEDPTAWNVEVYTGDDFLQKMIQEKAGNVMVVAGKNDRKIDYILAALENGMNVYADKPLVINPEGFQKLKKAFEIAGEKNLLFYDIMTERFEISTILQKELSGIEEVFGTIEQGTLENPAITKESVHHFFKYVSGAPLIRPEWFFDTEIEGSGLVDVTTHLVDLVQWEAFPGVVLDTTDVEMIDAKLLSTSLDYDQYKLVTGKTPPFQEGETLDVFANGEMNYTLKGIHAKVSVKWAFQAPEGTADTHYSIMRGTKADLIIRQGAEENYKPVLYVKLKEQQDEALEKAIQESLQGKYPGITLSKLANGEFKIEIPESYSVGHEAHFAQVTENYLKYFKAGELPDWEVPNMIVKYYTTTKAFDVAKKD